MSDEPVSAWHDYVVPWLRWYGAATPDEAALVVLHLGAVVR